MFIMEVNEQCQMCLLCNEILENDNFKPVKLKRHFNTKHNSYANKPMKFFPMLFEKIKTIMII